MRLASFWVLILVATLPAQHRQQQAQKSRPMPVHRPALGLLPIDALRELQAGAERAADQAKQHDSNAEPRRKPPGMGRYLAAIVVCADAGLDLPALFAQDAADLLILSSSGPVLRAAEVRAIEQAVSKHDLSLCLVITHENCDTLRQVRRGDAEGWFKRFLPSLKLAEKQAVSHADAHAVITARLLLESSESLRSSRQAGRFQVASLLLHKPSEREPPVLSWRAAWSQRPFQSSSARPPR